MDNNELRRQIALLSGALGTRVPQHLLKATPPKVDRRFHPYPSHKQPAPRRRTNLTLNNTNKGPPTTSTSTTAPAIPIPRPIPVAKPKPFLPSRNRKLVNATNPIAEPVKSGTSVDAEAKSGVTAPPATSFVKIGNKLVRVGAPTNTLSRPKPTSNPSRPPSVPNSLNRTPKRTLVTADGHQYKKSASGRKLILASRMAETPKRVININGVQFRRDPTGKKLIRQTGDSPAVKSKTPKQVLLNGLPYVRSKRGNLVLSRKTSLVKSPSLRRKSSIKARKFCNFYRFGKCDKGAKCRFVHDPKRLAVCPAYIKGECTKGVECKLSHSPTKENMPTCLHFERGRCRKEDCFYLHVKLSADAPVCRSFALEGYCEAGDECRNRHVYQCPDFAAGKCTNEKCRLPHKVAKKRELPPKHVGKGKRPLSKEEQEAQDKEDEELMKLPIRPDFSIEPEVFAQKLREAQAGRDGNESDSDDFDIGDEQLLYWPMEDDSPVGEEGHEGSDHSLNEDEPEDDNDDEDQPEEDDDDDAEDDAEAGGSDDSEPEVIELFSESDEDGSSDEEDGSPFVTSPTRLPPSQTIDLTDD